MRILMLGNSFTFANDMPAMLSDITGAEVVQHTRGGARLSEQLNPRTKLGKKTEEALNNESWDYVVLQEMSNGPIRYNVSFRKSVSRLCEKIRETDAIPILFATWAYQPGAKQYEEVGMGYEEMAAALAEAYREAAEENGALIADVGRRFFDLAESEELYAPDGSHPSERGSRIAAETIAEVIRKGLEKKGHTVVTRQETADSRTEGRLRLLYLYRMLMQYTDENHPMTTTQIQEKMEKEHGIYVHRTTIPGDIELLRAAGIEIFSRRSRQNKYYLEGRKFEIPELKILIDAVESSKFITEKKSRQLVTKLISLTSETNAGKLKRTLHTSGRVKCENEKGYYIVDAVNEAINTKKQILFFYTDFDARKRVVLRNGGKPYIVSPYTLIWNGDYYYMVGWNHEQEMIRTYRVDRIQNSPLILLDEAEPMPEDFDVSRYTKEVFRMYETQELVKVTLVCENDVMKGVIDQFGRDVKVKRLDKGHFKTIVKVCTSPTFYAWVFQWGGKVRIEGPEDVRKEFNRMAKEAAALSEKTVEAESTDK